MFIRGSFIEPESAFPACRAHMLIEPKRSCSIGEVSEQGIVIYVLTRASSSKNSELFDERFYFNYIEHGNDKGKFLEEIVRKGKKEIRVYLSFLNPSTSARDIERVW
jgi:hypothetical protein